MIFLQMRLGELPQTVRGFLCPDAFHYLTKEFGKSCRRKNPASFDIGTCKSKETRRVQIHSIQ